MMNSIALLAASTDPLGDLVGIVLWVARTLLLVIGGGGGLIMIVKGKSDENPKLTYEGFGAIAGAGVMFAATFAIQSIFS
ncbi:hypothetical protein [Ruminococcus flavefaciens]|uniref:hypothetical protein n=1 Tax=Ruminococcus flavefaciens TaxID=1265 RepID=UPI0026EEE539|nr:hypothetical protein [Ruminococcus flavefaciens]